MTTSLKQLDAPVVVGLTIELGF